MPLEIRELVIKATLSEGNGGGPESGTAGADTAAIVADCVAQVLAILKEKAER